MGEVNQKESRLTKRLHLLSFTTWYLLSSKPLQLEERLQKRLQNEIGKIEYYHHVSLLFIGHSWNSLELSKVGKAL